jgi:hypothetical protein
MSTAAEQRQFTRGLGVARIPRWKWTSAGLALGVLLTIVGFLINDLSSGLLLELAGFVTLFVTLVAFLLVGPSQDTDH